MKKMILASLMLFIGVQCSFAYNNGIGAFAGFPGSGYASSDTEYANINSYTEIWFSCYFTNGTGGYAYLKNGSSLVDSFQYQSESVYSHSATYTGSWNTMELGIDCSNGSIGLAELRW